MCNINSNVNNRYASDEYNNVNNRYASDEYKYMTICGDRGWGEKDGNISWKWSLRRSLACAALQKCVSTTTLTSASSATQLFQLESLLFTFAASTSHLFFFTLESSTAQPLYSCFWFFFVLPPPFSIFFNLVSSAKSWSAWIKPSVGQP